MGRVLLGAVVGAVVLFVWGFLFWAVLPFGEMAVFPVPNESGVAQALKDNLAASGAYYLPAPPESGQMDEAFVQKHKAGPLAQIFYRREGSDPTDPLYYLRGFGYMLVCALLLAVLMAQALPHLRSYGARVSFVLFAGLFAAAVASSGAVWWYQSLGYHLVYLIFNVSSWSLAGLAMAWVIKPQPS